MRIRNLGMAVAVCAILLVSVTPVAADSCNTRYDYCMWNCAWWGGDPTCYDGCWCMYECQCRGRLCSGYQECGGPLPG